MLHVLLHIEFGVPYSDHLTILSHLHLSVNKKIMFTIFNIVNSENESIYVHLYSQKKIKIVKCLTTKIYQFKVNISHFIKDSQVPDSDRHVNALSLWLLIQMY